ncbi:MAG: type II toxin-antitoxin system HicA family toxin [Nanoarchaeota archaeon]|nr:type II toxin-antitoxin system HicA family toxin [Nanoarchaeota archaeon]
MSQLKKISGQDCVKILCNKFGFKAKRQKGSHIILIKEISKGKVGTVVPLHKELKMPTLKNVLKLAKIDEGEFSKYQ